jgi:hypothetical protein
VDTPTYNADGYQTWKPQPGEYYKYGLTQRESYGGIVAALNDVKAAGSCGIPKSYPHNFAGIIAAIEDLADCMGQGNNIDIGPYPPGWEIIINIDGSIDGNWTELPEDGNLWFDTRQGRLFVAIDGAYWQTNGGDGLAYVSDGVPIQQPVIGSTWYDTYNKIMYVWTTDGMWEAVRGAEDVAQTTATLPLAFKQRLVDGRGSGNILPPDFPAQEDWPSILPPLDISQQNVQADYNEWELWALIELAKAVQGANGVYVQETAPVDDPPDRYIKTGDLWFDTNNLELSIYYEDDDTKQWVPTTAVYRYDEQLTRLNTAIAEETVTRQNAIDSLRSDLISRLENGAGEDEEARERINDLEASLTTIYQLNSEGQERTTELAADLDAAKESLQTAIDNVRSIIPSITHLQTKTVADETTADLEATIETLATSAELEQVSNSIPDISPLARSVDVTAEITAATEKFLPRTGGLFTGGIQMGKSDPTEAGFDFSEKNWYGQSALKFRSTAPAEEYATFGTTDKWWEYAWKFESEEDFCWVFNDREKVFSITKDGPACSTLLLGDIAENTEQGRRINNKIDLRERLTAYQEAFEEMRQGIATSTDFDSLKASLLSALGSV